MTPCHVVEIITPKKILLRGLWYGPQRAPRVFVFIHGLGGSAFSMRPVLERLVDKKTAVLSFNNRGFEFVTTLRSAKKNQTERVKGGAAHEVFKECVDDIDGAIRFAKKAGGKNIFLIGHSTGCQKSVYWASQKGGGKGIQGIVLLAPVSDWAAEKRRQGLKKLTRATKVARALVRQGKKHALLPEETWHEILDAQRFLSLYEPDSIEEIFPYAQPKKYPRMLRSVRKPVLVFWAEKDEFTSGQPTKHLTDWFQKNVPVGRIVTIPGVSHGFKGKEKNIVRSVREWVKRS